MANWMENSLRIFTFINGDVIGKVKLVREEATYSVIVLEEAHRLIITRDQHNNTQIMMADYATFTNSGDVEIWSNQICGSYVPSEDFVQFYEEQLQQMRAQKNGLVIPGANNNVVAGSFGKKIFNSNGGGFIKYVTSRHPFLSNYC